MLGHRLSKRASEGYDYTNATLVGTDINELEVRAHNKLNKLRAAKKKDKPKAPP